MNTKWITFGLVGLLAGSAIAQDTHPFYLKGTVVNPQGDFKKFLGGKNFGHAFELGYDFHQGKSPIGMAVFAAYQRVSGNENNNLVTVDTAGTQQPLHTTFGVDTWRFGIDMRFSTPVKGLVPYAGLNMNYHYGYWSGTSPVLGKASSLPDNKPKFGLRVGVEYFIAKNWAISADYNATEWRSDANEYVDPVTQTTVRRGSGYNPVNPSWVGLSVAYRFNWTL